MQLSIDLPEHLVQQLQSIPNSNEFICQAIFKALVPDRQPLELTTISTQAESGGLEAAKQEKRSLWEVIQTFRHQLEPGDLEPDEDVFAKVRDCSYGGEGKF